MKRELVVELWAQFLAPWISCSTIVFSLKFCTQLEHSKVCVRLYVLQLEHILKFM